MRIRLDLLDVSLNLGGASLLEISELLTAIHRELRSRDQCPDYLATAVDTARDELLHYVRTEERFRPDQ